MNISAVFLGTSHGDPSFTRFCSSTLYQFGSLNLLIDGAEPVTSLILRYNPQILLNLDAVFMTHMHMDHTGGLPDLARFIIKYKEDGGKTQFYFPEKDAIPVFRQWMKACHVLNNPDFLHLNSFQKDFVWEKEGVRITCIPTAHIENGRFPSYAFVLETSDFRILHTGDLAADFHDFPLNPQDKPCDICVCEATHIAGNMEIFEEKLTKAPIRKLILNHIGPLWTDGNEYKLQEITAKLPYPVIIAHDGLELDFVGKRN